MSTGISSIALTLPYDQAFQFVGGPLADQLGASALLYAAIAYYVFDDSFFAEDLLDHHPEDQEALLAWLQDLYDNVGSLFDSLRAYYERQTISSYHLLQVYYRRDAEELYVIAANDPDDDHLGNQWRFLTESSSPYGTY